ncbi:hypothetical protein [Neptunomonas marina]|uniref:Uncharacterized protein n=1 Tax=Neptunomonas marina TaxID=1815562 RepID=A0A437Q781_9GAMM|nr:hypothetical protein [Neptunomonas marina]RVU30233.1 hypothetical protein EOE65_11305 [Neptunomonas marina]
MEIHSQFDSDLPENEGISIAIMSYGLRQQHVGIYFKVDGDQLRLLHQPWHRDVLIGDPSNKYLWLDVALDPDNQTHMATMCEMIGGMNPDGIPYSICNRGTSFSALGVYEAEHAYAGLTCATFVMRVFESNGFPIINEDDWSHITPDRTWQTQILQALENAGVDKNHMAYQLQRKQEGVTRYKPEEVATAAALPMSDKGYAPEDVHDGAAEIMTQLGAHISKLEKKSSPVVKN